ncbi:MAG: PQQ-binding-like beta-propeller repeat protein [Haloarculaceae archaeon]
MYGTRTVKGGSRRALVVLACLVLLVTPVTAATGDWGDDDGLGTADDPEWHALAPAPVPAAGGYFDVDWPTYRGNRTRTGYVPGTTGPVSNVSVLWNATDDSYGPPVVDNGTVFANNGSAMKAFDADTGTLLWEFHIPNVTAYDEYFNRDQSPTVYGDRVYGVTSGYLLGFNVSTGALEVTYQAQNTPSGADSAAVAAANDTLYFALEYDDPDPLVGSRMYAVGTNGTEHWTNDSEFLYTDNYITYADRTVFFQSGGSYTAYNASNGTRLWRHSFAQYVDVASVDDGMLYFTSHNTDSDSYPSDADYVFGVNATSGDTAWRFNVSAAAGDDTTIVPGGLSTDGSTVYAFDDHGPTNQTLYALDASNGDLLWSRAYPGVDDVEESVVADGILYGSGTHDGRVHAFDASNGDLLWNVSLPYYLNGPASRLPSSPAVSDDGVLYVGTVDGLVAIGEGVHYSDLVVSETSPGINDTVAVTATVSNPQSTARDYTAKLLVDGVAWDSTSGTLAPGASTDVSFTTRFQYPTDYEVTVGNHPTQADYDPVVVSVGPQPTGEWPHYRGGPNGTGVTSASGPTSNLTHLWNVTFGTQPGTLDSPVVADGLVFAGTDDDLGNYYGNLSAYDVATGEVVWLKKGFEPLGTGAVADGVLYVIVNNDDTSNWLYALDTATGNVEWQASLSSYPSNGANPTVAGDTVYFGLNDKTVYALNASDGSERWTHVLPDDVYTTPTVVGDTAYVGDDYGTLYALATADGRERWNVTVGGYTSTAAVEGGTVYVADDDLLAVDAATGTVDWNTTLPSGVDYSDPAVADGVVYVGTTDGTLRAVDAATGDYLWNATVSGGDLGPPVVANGAVYVIDDADGLWVFDAANGDELGRWEKDAFAGAPAVVNDYVYLFGEPVYDYALVALRGTSKTTTTGTLSVSGTTDFGDVVVGQTENVTLSVENTGSVPVSVTDTSVLGADAGAFAVADGGAPFTLAPSATRAVNVTFAPTRAGEHDATLRITSNATTPQRNVSLAGTGLDEVLTPSPATLDFGDVEVNATESKTVSLTASGGLPVNVTGLSIAGADAGRFAITAGTATNVSAGATLDATVAVTPNATGALSATLAVATDDPGVGTVTVPLTATGTAVPPAPTATPTATPSDAGGSTGSTGGGSSGGGSSPPPTTPTGTPDIAVVSASLSPSAIVAGETTTLEATLRNDGTRAGRLEARLFVDGADTGESRIVDLDAGAETTVTITRRFDVPGEYTLRIGTQTVGPLRVQAAGTGSGGSTASTGGGDSSPTDPAAATAAAEPGTAAPGTTGAATATQTSQPGFGVGLAILGLLGGLLALRRA